MVFIVGKRENLCRLYRRALNYQAFIRISETRMHAPISFSPLDCIFSVVNIYMIYNEFNDAHCGFVLSYNELCYAGVTFNASFYAID